MLTNGLMDQICIPSQYLLYVHHCNSLHCKTLDIFIVFFPTSLFLHVFVKSVIEVECYNWLECLIFGVKNYFSNLKNVSSDIF